MKEIWDYQEAEFYAQHFRVSFERARLHKTHRSVQLCTWCFQRQESASQFIWLTIPRGVCKAEGQLSAICGNSLSSGALVPKGKDRKKETVARGDRVSLTALLFPYSLTQEAHRTTQLILSQESVTRFSLVPNVKARVSEPSICVSSFAFCAFARPWNCTVSPSLLDWFPNHDKRWQKNALLPFYRTVRNGSLCD